MTFIVYEYTEKASPQYRGVRFMTSDDGQPIVDDGNTKMIARGLSEADAYALADVTLEKNIETFLSNMPEEYCNPENDAFIRNLMKNDSKGNI